MTKPEKISLIALSAVVVIIAAVVVYLKMKKAPAKPVLGTSAIAPNLAPAYAKTTLPPNMIPLKPVVTNKAPTGAFNPSLGGAAKTGVQASMAAVPNVLNVGTDDLSTGCNTLLAWLPVNNPDLIPLKAAPVDTVLFRNLYNEWYAQIKYHMSGITSVLNNNSLTTGINSLLSRIATLPTNNPQITYTDAANGLVWWDMIIRQTLIEERINVYQQIINNFHAQAASGNINSLIAGTYMNWYNSWTNGAVPQLTTLLTNMGQDNNVTNLTNHEQQAWNILNSWQPKIDPTNAQLQAAIQKNANDNATALKITMLVVSLIL